MSAAPEPTTTRTLNRLPFDALEPKRFEDLIRQLVYDFRRWRKLEATGRAGGDDGYDARGFEITNGAADEPPEPSDGDEEPEMPEPTTDNLWLIQCKREQRITPAKMKSHLSKIAEAEASKLYGLIFAAACDFSKQTRDLALAWARERGIAEVYMWGKGELEDQLFQPKNDHLLFAYFGISLQIRKRSMRTALRARLTMKRKVMRHLGDGPHVNKLILLRDPEDEDYPHPNEDTDPIHRGWRVTEFGGNHVDGIKINWGSYFAFFAEDGKRWDFAKGYSRPPPLLRVRGDPWLSEEEMQKQDKLREQIQEFWCNQIAENERADFKLGLLIKYDDIMEIDEKGDNVAKYPHVFVKLKNGAPLHPNWCGKLIVRGEIQEMNGIPSLGEPRTLVNPAVSDRIDIFPSEFRKPVR